jgi:hypothetical protein
MVVNLLLNAIFVLIKKAFNGKYQKNKRRINYKGFC